MPAWLQPISRRSFLLTITGGTIFSGLGFLWSLDYVRARGNATSFPVWHPQASGFNHDDGLLVRLLLDDWTARELILSPCEAEVWCLCDGSNSEADLARALRVRQPEAITEFVDSLVNLGFLVRAHDQRSGLPWNEEEAAPYEGSRPWPKRTA